MRLDTATLGGLFDVQLPRATVNNVPGNDNQVRLAQFETSSRFTHGSSL